MNYEFCFVFEMKQEGSQSLRKLPLRRIFCVRVLSVFLDPLFIYLFFLRSLLSVQLCPSRKIC